MALMSFNDITIRSLAGLKIVGMCLASLHIKLKRADNNLNSRGLGTLVKSLITV